SDDSSGARVVMPCHRGHLMKKVLIILGVVVVLAAIGQRIDPSRRPAAARAAGAASTDTGPSRPSPAAVVTARELFDAYESNEIAAGERYKDRWIQVSGSVDDIGKDLLGDLYVTLDAGTPIF